MGTLIYFSTGNSYRCYNTSTSTSTSTSTVPVGSFCYQQWCTGSIVPVGSYVPAIVRKGY